MALEAYVPILIEVEVSLVMFASFWAYLAAAFWFLLFVEVPNFLPWAFAAFF